MHKEDSLNSHHSQFVDSMREIDHIKCDKNLFDSLIECIDVDSEPFIEESSIIQI
jgi:hypothetical protein